MTTTTQRATASPAANAAPARAPLRRTCACGTHTPLGGECDGCKKKKVQAKFAVGAANDAFEYEADRVADRVMRDAAAGGTSPAPVAVQRAADRATDGADAPASVDAVLARDGAPLAAGLRADMEARFGHDFSQVRTHTDPAAERSAQEIGAAAYTAGHHVVFGRGHYAPATQSGRRLIAHELTHVLQQTPGIVRRKPAPKAKAKTAADAPKLDFRAAKNSPPCACIVFIHHNEKNAGLIASLLHEFCKYNLAIVDPATNERHIDLIGTGDIDPNELFPRDVAEACWDDDKPCEKFQTDNAGKTAKKDVIAVAQRQFFLAIKKCSKGFTLPIVGLHNNTVGDTTSYRDDIAKTSGGPDVSKIKGKTFDKSVKPGDKAPADTLPFDDFTTWVKTLSGVAENKTTKKLGGGPFGANKTNIFIWCNANDNTKCQIGDPEHPDNVVWVTNTADFDKLRGKPVNVALQTQVDPKGNSQTDLSSLFVFLSQIIGDHYDKIDVLLATQTTEDIKGIVDALSALLVSPPAGPDPELEQWRNLGRLILHTARLQLNRQGSAQSAAERKTKTEQLRFVNIESPHTSDEKGVGEADFRVKSLNRVRTTLAALGLDCCDTTAAPGQTDSPAKQLEDAVRAGAKPKAK